MHPALVLVCTLVLQQGINGYDGCRDTYVLSHHPDISFADAIYIEVIVAEGTTGIAFIDFDGFPHECVLACTLALYCYNALGQDMELSIYEIGEPWDPASVTWENQPSRGNYITGEVVREDAPAWHLFPLSRWPEHGIVLVCKDPPTYVRSYRSSEMAGTSQPPKLILRMAPAAIWSQPVTTWGRLKMLWN